MELKGAVGLVTGASRGIGRAIADTLARAGARLVLNGLRKDPLEAAAGELRKQGAEVETVAGDVGDEASASAMVQAAISKWGRLDVLVNNAGIGPASPLVEMDPSLFDQVMRTNVRGPYLLMRAAIPPMKKQGGGTIVNIASLAGVNPVPQKAAYAASKWALIGMTRSLMGEVRKDKIRLILIEPGSTLTDFGHNPDEKRAKADKIVHPCDVAEVVLAALKLPERATVSEIEIRPTDP